MSAIAYAVVIAAWATVLVYMLPAVWSIYVKRARQGDPARLICAAVSIVMTGFLVRRMATGEPVDQSLAALLALSFATAVSMLRVARSYGRGDRV